MRALDSMILVAALAATAATGACRRTAPGSRSTTVESAPEVPFVLRRDTTDVVFTWFDAQGAAQTATQAIAVPVGRREMVRVDPSRPELRAAGWVYVADLRAANDRGEYAVRAMRPDALSQRILAMGGHQGGLGTQPPSAPPAPSVAQGNGAQPTPPNGRPAVIIYGASWCTACHQAAEYLRGRHVSFVERDIEADPSAAEELRDKARRAGVPMGSIPILDVRGRILVGFSPPAIDGALAQGT